MQKFVICGALLGALLFVTVENTEACTRPEAIIGSPEKLAEQNAIIDAFHIPRMVDSQTIEALAAVGELVELPERGLGYRLDGIGKNKQGCRDYLYPEKLRYVHPSAADMVWYLGVWFAGKYPGDELKIPGATRTPAWQEWLMACNGNAVRGDQPSERSAHLSGLAVDISKKELPGEHICALWDKCIEMQERGWVLCTDETVENNIHVFVHPEFTVLATLKPYPEPDGSVILMEFFEEP